MTHMIVQCVRAEVIIVISQSATFNLQKWNVLKRFVTMARAHEKDVVTINECDKDRRSAKDRLRKDERTNERTNWQTDGEESG